MKATHRILLGLVTLALGACDVSTSSSVSPVGGPVVNSAPLPFAWPPVAGETYPDLQLLDHRGRAVRLSDFAGQVLLVEPIGMT